MNDQWYKWREFKMKNSKLICVCAKIKLKKLIVLDLIHSKKYLFEMWRTLIKTRKVLSRYYSLLSYYLRCSLIKVYLYFGRSRIYKFRSSFSKIVRILLGSWISHVVYYSACSVHLTSYSRFGISSNISWSGFLSNFAKTLNRLC